MATDKDLELYDRLIETQPEIERKGKATSYTSLNGHMFSFLTKEGPLALRLADDRREAFAQKFKTEPVVQNGSIMKEYVLVPDRLFKRTKDLASYFAESVEYIRTLKPKPTTRKKAAKKPVAKKKAAKKKTAKKAAKKTAKKATQKSAVRKG